MAKANFVNVRCEFSPNGEYLACADSTGALQIWEASTGSKKQQYVPDLHLTATCSCISWATKRHTVADESSPSKKKKKRRSDVEKSVDELDLIAVGTERGTILLYSYTKNALHTQLSDGHTDRVTDVAWNQTDDSLYSCSADGCIVDWSLAKSCRKQKWKAEDSAVFSLCLCHTRRHLLSAARTIKLWDLDTRQVLQTISGHQFPVLRLLEVPGSKSIHRSGDEEVEASVDGAYIISADITDRHISIWQVNPSSNKKKVRKTITSLTLPDDPACHLAINTSQRSGKLQVAALTARGKVAVFEHVLNGPTGPLEPARVVEVKTSSSSSAGTQLPISAMQLTAESMNIVYSSDSFWQPTFEKLSWDSLSDSKNCSLVRKAASLSAVAIEASVSKLKKPVISEDVRVVSGGGVLPAAAATSLGNTDATEPLRKRRRRHSQSITVEERLNAIGVHDPVAGGDGQTKSSKDGIPKTYSLSTLLTQGLVSNDRKMLNSVLQRRDMNVIEQTVRRLPLSAVVPLIKELSRRMSGHAVGALVIRLWLKSVMTLHAAYLMSLPDRDSVLGPLHEVMETRLDVMRKVCQLQGRLDLIFDQLAARDKKSESWKDTAQLVYKDESSSDEADDDYAVDDTDAVSEDEWEPQNDNSDSGDDDDDDDSDDDNADDDDEASDNNDSDNGVVVANHKPPPVKSAKADKTGRRNKAELIDNSDAENADSDDE